MRQISFLLMAVILFASCKERDSFKKGDNGLSYKIISSTSEPVIKPGEIMQLEIIQYYQTGGKDSLLQDSRENFIPVLESLDSTTLPIEYYNIFKQTKKGDSIVIKMLSDSVFKDNSNPMPPFFKKGHILLTSIKIVDVFKDRETAEARRKELMAIAQKKQEEKVLEHEKTDDEALQKYFAEKNIKVQKSPKGMYVEIITPGTGNNIDTNVVVEVNYTGRNFAGKTFDSNTDPAFNHVEPFYVNMTSDPTLGNGVIAGWIDGLKMLNKGAKARFYIPSGLGYGARGVSAEITPFSNLIFDIEVKDILTKEQAKANAEKEMAKRREMEQSLNLQKQIQEELQKNSEPKK